MSNYHKLPLCHPNEKYYALDLCRNCYSKRKYKQNPTKVKEATSKYIKKHPEIMLLVAAKARAKEKLLEFTLQVSDIHIPSTCPVLGIPIIPFNGKFSHNSPSIDRIDNSRGYTPDNIIVISFRANSLKKDATVDELEKVATFFRSLQSTSTDGT